MRSDFKYLQFGHIIKKNLNCIELIEGGKFNQNYETFSSYVLLKYHTIEMCSLMIPSMAPLITDPPSTSSINL